MILKIYRINKYANQTRAILDEYGTNNIAIITRHLNQINYIKKSHCIAFIRGFIAGCGRYIKEVKNIKEQDAVVEEFRKLLRNCYPLASSMAKVVIEVLLEGEKNV